MISGALAILAGLGGLAWAQLPATALRAERWIAPGSDRVMVLSREPTECLAWPSDPARRLSVAVGRAAFRDPLLLGGQAARAGVSCESCHRAGRGNPDFHFPGVSGAAGTADVTSSLFSSHRGDGVDNPKPIPDLSVEKSRLKVAQDRSSGDLERFIAGLVTEEFDGRPPPAAVLSGLADYVRALDPRACPAQASRPITAQDLLADVDQALATAANLSAQGDNAAAQAMVRAARSRLFLVDERLSDRWLKTRLRAFDQTLSRARTPRAMTAACSELDQVVAPAVLRNR
ncbi:MAG: hypothetical protein CFE28_04470 [Alphaproteobacteria bacterium PA2]|nr:MAG: hypothetical protein CFE28_04470 [Alphaproteobacteria bacterium PA2]